MRHGVRLEAPKRTLWTARTSSQTLPIRSDGPQERDTKNNRAVRIVFEKLRSFRPGLSRITAQALRTARNSVRHELWA